MNNNRNNNNNRRRGRGNRQQGGGGNQNRIDSRARGNAPQMLDKYKKLAQDAQHNGDRVQAEYYLQFADHYFRVIADNRSRQDEQRGGQPRQNERDYQSDDESFDDDFDSQRSSYRDERPARDDRPRDDRPRDDRPRDDRPRDDRSRDDRPARGNDRQRSRARRDDSDGQPREGDASAFEPADNPFVRPVRGDEDGGEQTRPANAPRRGRGRRDAGFAERESLPDNAGEIDAAALPPAFSATVANEDDGQAPRKLAPRRRRKAADEDDGESLTAVG